MTKGPTFQRRHYKAIASLLANFKYQPIGADCQHAMIEEFSSMFAADNARFDRARFLAAASGQPINGRDKV